ncbi:MAG: chorismate synthase [Candidatus Jacksonbacteria bacterium RIFOXYC2_FULL_44_29]|nr:MAG: Chorismate synthase [Parcubacteria group bacterium GW2011_GWC2_44_22]OGY75380.1 MAG: chorismate synthase [Candidatus Jacksonbacteria bacterium RIFOXYA2_FULL_43_12]OGY77084.1 MAG: chorismate synthase [Candidatus Jacksonbacteria bacterium RIFOXYB2_FULL_44_15]OGY78355.1 MAG: chorismate synthase [Candidatus Jacksonbacteria bacterium RIFOXYD2_FULL_43_21]OGY79820.1 MAG: chorismate synthase [Candidatus Jacksonbacteria bacterium RIFOXYC2_FULL_44_29]HBH46859.1 chorismate synthase [Candidatus Ja
MNTFGKFFRITTWGESHGRAVGVVIDGCPAGLNFLVSDIQTELDRRRPGQSTVTTGRKEEDFAEILSGVFEDKTLGTPISIIVWNKDAHSNDYNAVKNIFRPGHADFTWQAKFGTRDYRGGGRASGRETVGRVAGGAVARKILSLIGVEVVGYVKEIANLKCQMPNIKCQKKSKAQISNFKRLIEANIVRCPDEEASKKMIKLIEETKSAGDSVGGVVELVAFGVPAGWGEPVFSKLSADLAVALMSIPAVKGVEIGSGFAATTMRGSEHNDQFKVQSSKFKVKEVISMTNNAGGILGGISNGMPIIARIAVKPTSSIASEQNTVDEYGQNKKIKITGRHDPCICPRVVPVAEAMMALVLADHYLLNRLSKIESIKL